jgi:DNA-binding response OmpR family regulator
VETAEDGARGLEMATTRRYDAVVIDIRLPGVDGVQAIRRVRATPGLAALPIVALTGLSSAADRRRCLDAGASAYLSKPVRLRELLETVRELLTRRAAGDQSACQ